jgi:hypothetical protein
VAVVTAQVLQQEALPLEVTALLEQMLVAVEIKEAIVVLLRQH